MERVAKVAVVLAAVLCSGCAPKETPPPTCTPKTSFTATGFFRVEQDCDRWWFVDPLGQRFFSAGINHITFDGDTSRVTHQSLFGQTVRAKYGTPDAWADAVQQRMNAWGFNTVGAWSTIDVLGTRMPYTVIMGLGGSDDYFAPAWEASARAEAASAARGHQDDPNLLGYFIDNELHWGPDWRSQRPLFDDYLARPATAPGKVQLVAILKDRHQGDLARFNAAWGTSFTSFDEVLAVTELPSLRRSDARADMSAFLSALATRYYSVATSAVREADPNHLVLGSRLVSALTPLEVAAAASLVDVVSVNAYEFEPAVAPYTVWEPRTWGYVPLDTPQWLQVFHELSGRPVMVTEFSFRARDSGLPNTYPPVFPVLSTQAERADRFEAYVRRCQEAPYIVGYHWFEWADEPADGRFDGEDSNFGVVSERDEPYETLTTRAAALNAAFP